VQSHWTITFVHLLLKEGKKTNEFECSDIDNNGYFCLLFFFFSLFINNTFVFLLQVLLCDFKYVTLSKDYEDLILNMLLYQKDMKMSSLI
jgi:hypothetical protein